MAVDVAATLAGLAALSVRVDAATEQATADVLHLLQASAMGLAPVGVAGNSTNAPGDLRRSILVEGPAGGGHTWAGRVGPTVIYGRQRELGGHIFPVSARALVFTKFGTMFVVDHVYQKPRPFMKPAYEAVKADADAVVVGRLAAAVEGGV